MLSPFKSKIFILPYSCFLDFSNVHQNEIEEGHIFKCTLPIAFVMIALAWTSSNKSDLSALLFTGRFVWDKLQLNGLYCIGIFYSESTDSSYPKTDEPIYFPELEILKLHTYLSKSDLKLRRNWRCLKVWRLRDLAAQENNLVHMFEDMTNASVLYEKKLPLII